ncbi:Putative metabolite transport protein NicT [Pseudomonas veronii 1YdBTEX2]|jgi:sugar phosphate permease|uniref:Metabolite transport protein NicT n=1 Tax=Pseudomonas veronii 1YdBTEX2 TaxID=1295141 RepID=A0A1D3JTP3_PSEVE|nr:MFS transporter [Pseudomonas veronii]SBW79444.1 Putative metabolite transport protein NicT [Pseudomonas veronii 1YdBTEX2]
MNTTELKSKLYKKISWRILPFLLLCYVFAYLDRVNIGFAKLQMQSDLGFSDAVYGLGAGVFFIGYALFEVPSNLLLPKVGARKTFSRILILWGLTATCMLFVTNEMTFYVLRFLLGVFEAGFAPGMIFYLTYWYGQDRMAGVMATVMLAAPLAGIFGGPLSAWIMSSFHSMSSLAGWQWMFLIEGLPCVILGIMALYVLADRPADAKWLNDEEKKLLMQDTNTSGVQHHSFKEVIKDPRVFLLGAAYFTLICGIYTLGFWLPTIIRDAGVADVMSIGLYSAIPYIITVIAMQVYSRRSDRLAERRWHTAIPALVSAIALATATLFNGQLALSMIFITVATVSVWMAYTVFWAIPSQHFKGSAAAGAIALINTIGLLGGFFSPTIIGYTKTLTNSTQAGLLVMAVLLVLGSLLLALNRKPAAVGSSATAY